MTGRTFTEDVAHLLAMADLKPGDRVRVTRSGRTGTLVKRNVRHNGWRVRWDVPVFGATDSDVQPSMLERERG